MLFLQTPPDFVPKYQTVGCFCHYQDKILLLKRQRNKREGDKWGLPAGKVEQNETQNQAILREIQEETGFRIKDDQVKFLTTAYIRYPDHDFIFHIYQTDLEDKKVPKIDPTEHQSFRWATPKAALTMDLVKDFGQIIKMVYFTLG